MREFWIAASGAAVVCFAILIAVDRYLRKPPRRYMLAR